jgi:hypothetical protein
MIIKTCLKFLLAIAIYTVVNLTATAFLPFSPELIESGASAGVNVILFMLINVAFICFTIYFIIINSQYNGKILFFRILFVMFFVVSFITQVGTLYSIYPVNVFEGYMTGYDFILLMPVHFLSLLATIPLLMKFFQNKSTLDTKIEKKTVKISSIILKLGIFGITYLFIYVVFGFLVQWRFSEFSSFYLNTAWGQVVWGGNRSGLFLFISYQILRGILSGLFVFPLLSIITKSKSIFIISICLVYLCPAAGLLVPSPIMPNIVRFLHIFGISITMIIFGIIVGNVWWKNKTT